MTGLGTVPVRDGGDPAISVVIPHYNDLENLDLCLGDLAVQQVPAGCFEVVVADNNSRCDRRQLEAVCAGRARLIDAPIQGAAAARNAGVAAARAPLLAFIDSDCRPSPDWLAQGLDALKSHALVGGQVNVGVGDRAALTAAEAFERVFAFNNERYIREERFSVTANLFTTRALFDHVGGFRPGVSEDVEWGQRAAAMGYAWHYEPKARLEHPARRSWDELHRKWQRLMQEGFRLSRERRTPLSTWILRAWLVLLQTPLAALTVVRSRQLTTLADRRRAIAILVRLRAWRFMRAHQLMWASLLGR